MELMPVTSSNIAMVGYDSETLEMHIQFRSGHVYAYYGVPEDVYHNLINASSVGSFFHYNVRGRYGDTRIG